MNINKLFVFQTPFGLGRFPIDMALDEHIDIIICRNPNLQSFTYYFRMFQHYIPQLERSSPTYQAI